MYTIDEYEITSGDRNAIRAFRKAIADAISKSVSPNYYLTLLRYNVNGRSYYCTLIVRLDNSKREDDLATALNFYSNEHDVKVTFIDSQTRTGEAQ